MSIKDLVPRIRRNPVARDRAETSPMVPLQREINRLFDDFWSDWGLDLPSGGRAGVPALFEPRVNVVETDQEFKVTAELPGMDEKDVQILLDNDTLTLQGEKKEEKEDKEGDYHRIERSYGSFQRIFRLISCKHVVFLTEVCYKCGEKHNYHHMEACITWPTNSSGMS